MVQTTDWKFVTYHSEIRKNSQIQPNFLNKFIEIRFSRPYNYNWYKKITQLKK